MFDNISDLDLHGKVVLDHEWTLSKRLGLAYTPGTTFLCCNFSLHLKRSMGDSTFSSISLLGILGPGDRRLCMRLALHVHYRPFSVTSEESLRHSEPPLMDTRAPRDRSECVKLVLVSFTLIS